LTVLKNVWQQHFSYSEFIQIYIVHTDCIYPLKSLLSFMMINVKKSNKTIVSNLFLQCSLLSRSRKWSKTRHDSN